MGKNEEEVDEFWAKIKKWFITRFIACEILLIVSFNINFLAAIPWSLILVFSLAFVELMIRSAWDDFRKKPNLQTFLEFIVFLLILFWGLTNQSDPPYFTP